MAARCAVVQVHGTYVESPLNRWRAPRPTYAARAECCVTLKGSRYETGGLGFVGLWVVGLSANPLVANAADFAGGGTGGIPDANVAGINVTFNVRR